MNIDANKWPKLCVLLLTAVIHGVLLFGVVFNNDAAAKIIEEASFINLVNIEEYSEPAAPKKAAQPKVPDEPVIAKDDAAEDIIETEELPPEVSGVTDGEADSEEGSAAYISEYTKNNYNYIQKRIMQELIYPSQARRAGIQGVVEVVFVINTDGSIQETAVRRSSDKIILDEEALRAVKNAAPFRPPQRPVRIVIPVSFKLT